jgi:hypothetical protein
MAFCHEQALVNGERAVKAQERISDILAEGSAAISSIEGRFPLRAGASLDRIADALDARNQILFFRGAEPERLH